MIIVAGGDSFVWGSELSDHRHGGGGGHSRKTFTALLAADNEYACLAYPGDSNWQIMQHISNCTKSPDRRELDLFVIACWTWPTRGHNASHSRVAVHNTQTCLKEYNIPYLFTCADNCLLEWLSDDTDWDNWFLFPPAEESWNTQQPRGFYQWAVENKYPVGPDGHPLDAAHQDAALLIKDKFNEVVKKHLEQNGSGNPISQETQRT